MRAIITALFVNDSVINQLLSVLQWCCHQSSKKETSAKVTTVVTESVLSNDMKEVLLPFTEVKVSNLLKETLNAEV